MCGICGIIGGKITKEEREASVARMTQLLAHRGPDGEGFAKGESFTLGHRRLAIIDLSTGSQPMWTKDGRYCIVYNGELYNYLELRQQLVRLGESFTTFSDTEVLLLLLVRYGIVEALKQCNGMFAFALYDTHTQTLTLARDHCGIKPLYYTQTAHGGLAFASEIKALFGHPDVKAEADTSGIGQYLFFQFCLGQKTLFHNIHKLEPGHYLTFSTNTTPCVKKWFELSVTIDTRYSDEYFLDTLLLSLQDSVRMQLRSDVALGTYLSGGLDSSAITALVARHTNETISCFTGRFIDIEGYDESHYAAAVANHVKANLHIITPTANDFVQWMPKIIYALDEPCAGPGVFPQFLVSKLAKEHVTVCLGGQGADELFGGYARYLVAYLEQALKGAIFETQHDGRFVLTLESMIPNLPVLKPYAPLMQQLWQEGLFGKLEHRYLRLLNRAPDLLPMLTDDWRNSIKQEHIEELFIHAFMEPEHQSSINRMLHFDQRTLLPALLQIEDRASMSASLESRVPFLSPQLLQLAASMPPTLKLKDGKLKHALLEAVKNFLPKEVIERKDKMGFPVPLGQWIQGGIVREFVYDTLGSTKAKQRGIFAHQAIDQLLSAKRPGNRQLWGVLCLELWYQRFIDEKVVH